MQTAPAGWTAQKLDALNALIETALAYQVLNTVITAAGDATPAAAQLKADVVALARSQLAALKAAP